MDSKRAQAMPCRLLGFKPLHGPMLPCCQFEQISMKFQ